MLINQNLFNEDLMTDFVQDETYSKKIGTYRKFFSLLNHDPKIFNLPPHSKFVNIEFGYGN
jgi:hypothetical protein